MKYHPIGNVTFLWLLLLACLPARGQEISITKFEQNPFNLEARSEPRLDGNKEECALIRFMVRRNDFEIDGNLGVVDTIRETGIIKVYVPHGTKKLTIRCQGMYPLEDYRIPVRIEKRGAYDAWIEIVDNKETVSAPIEPAGSHLFMGVGFNALSIMGPSVCIGAELNRHIVEASFVYGLNKSDALYYYSTDGELQTAREYKAMRTQLRYGYGFPIGNVVTLTPLVGACYNFVKGHPIDGIAKDNAYKEQGWSISANGALRLSAKIGKSVRLHLTPEYDILVHESSMCKTFNESDSKIKSWSQGFNLNIGVLIYF